MVTNPNVQRHQGMGEREPADRVEMRYPAKDLLSAHTSEA
jgi:hypothetical protein